MSLHKKLQLGEGEEILGVIRSVYATQWFIYTLGALILAGMAFVSFWLFAKGPLGVAFFILGIILGIFVLIHAYRYNQRLFWVITTDRLIEIEQPTFLQQKITALGYDELGEVSVVKRGLVSTLLNHATIVVPIGDTGEGIEMEAVRQPHFFHQMIVERQQYNREAVSIQKLANVFTAFLDALPNFSEAQLLMIEKRIDERLSQVDNERSRSL